MCQCTQFGSLRDSLKMLAGLIAPRLRLGHTEKQKKLEPDHKFSWSDGEQAYSADLEDQLLLNVAKQRDIAAMSHVELFELFFSS